MQWSLPAREGGASTSFCRHAAQQVAQPSAPRRGTDSHTSSARGSRPGVVCALGKSAQAQPSVVVAEPVQEPPRPVGLPLVSCAALAAAAAAAAVWRWRASAGSDLLLERAGSRGGAAGGYGGADYQGALARTRQAVHSHNAIVYMNAGNPARALVELKRALTENSTVREPLLSARLEKEDLLGLYRLHLINSEVPPDFPTLLQLRELFALSDAEAEAMEAEIMGSGDRFSI